MAFVETPQITWLLLLVQVLGLTVAWVARLSEGSSFQGGLQIAFLALLTLVGGATVAALGLGPGRWLPSGVTLAVMVLAVTCDFSRCRRDIVW
jgi:hypothetical protein